ncbi:MAG: ABC transporter substrate-binding protein [Methyloligellaceae bacterium]
MTQKTPSDHQEHHDESFQEDLLKILIEKSSKDPVPRRLFLKTAAYLGVSAALYRMTPAFAGQNELVVVNWGGDAVTAHKKAWVSRFAKTQKDTKVIIDGSGPSSGKIKAMVQSGKVTWDLCDRNLIAAVDLGRQGLLGKVDYSRVDTNAVRPHHRNDWGLGAYLYSFALTWDTKAFAKAPKNWKDFWNLKDFPGTRTLRKNFEGQMEAALLADGVPPDKIYPVDVDRALAKIKEIKENTIFWGSGSESQQIMRDGDAVMGNLWHTRSSIVNRETKGRVDYTFNEAILFAGAWIQPKGAPAGKKAWDFAAAAQDPQSQVEVFQMLGSGPINPKAAALVPENLRHRDAGNPKNLAVQIPSDANWYASDYANILNRYLDTIAS